MTPPTVHIVVITAQAEHALLPDDIVAEFDTLLTHLDSYNLTRPGWQRFKTILTIATLEASNIEAGQQGYILAREKWRRSRYYEPGYD